MYKILVLTLVCFSNVSGIFTTPDVVGSQTKADRLGAPWIVSLQRYQNDFAFCGATLIKSITETPQNKTQIVNCSGWIVTAASCLDGITNDTVLTLGNFDLTGTAGWKMTITRIVTHTDFNVNSHQNDIALVQVNFELNTTEVQEQLSINITACENFPVLSYTSEFKINETLYDKINASFSGWGLLKEDGPLQKELYNTSLPLLGDRVCMEHYGHDVYNGSSMLCAGGLGVGPCSYDTGGPLACQYKNENTGTVEKFLCGIASRGHGCGRANGAGIFTDVVSFRDWIACKVDKKCPENPEPLT